MDGLGPLLPAAVDPAMASNASLASFDEDGSRRPSSSSLVARSSRMSNNTRQKSGQHPYRFDGQMVGPLRRKVTTAPTAWPRDPSTLTTSGLTGRSNRDSLEMSLDPFKMDTTKKALGERRHNRKREGHLPSCSFTIPLNANSFESPTERPNGEANSPFLLPVNNSTVTPTKPANTPSFFSAMFSKNSTGPSIPRTPSSNSPNRPSTVRRIARTLLEWNLGPQTDLTRWQRDSPRTPRTPRQANRPSISDDLLSEDNTMRSPD